MVNTYLNKNTRFKCGSGNAVWFKPKSDKSNVNVNGAEVLLDNCKLELIGGTRPGQCNLIPDPTTGAPGMCNSTQISGIWENNVRLKINGKGALTNACSIVCPFGGKIKSFRPTTMALNVDNNAKEQNVIMDNGTIKKTKNQENKKSELEDGSSNSNFAKKENDVFENIDEEVGGKDVIEDVQYALCDYKNCRKAKECKYLKTQHTLIELNESKNAAELKINMGKDSFDLYAGECVDIATSLYGSYMYSIAHHHIIPANQCFKNFAEIVKLANFYNYNINKAENGISLPTMNLGYDKQSFEVRKKISFNAMETLGKQWHKGGHKYSCKISAELDSVLSRPFVNYKDAVDKELISFNIKLTDEMKCRCENYSEQAEEFIKIMDHICEKIAKKLRRFEDDAKKSYPCYISKFAFYYAFQEELSAYENELFGKEE